MPPLKPLASTLALVAMTLASVAASSEVVVAHATTDKLSAVLTNRVADVFEGRKLDGEELVRARVSTPAQVAASLCGTSSEAYLIRAEHDNKIKLDRNHALGSAADITWPACLRVTPLNPAARLPDKATASQNPLMSFFGRLKSPSLLGWFNSAKAFVSPPVLLTPKSGTTAQAAADYAFPKPAAAPSPAAVEAVGTTATGLNGHIVEQATVGVNVDANSEQVKACSTGKAFDAALVAEAYRWSKIEQARERVVSGRASVFVVDNGFFGSVPGVAEPFAGSVFSPRLFDWNGRDGELGPNTPYGDVDIWPNNFQNGFTPGTVPTAVQGHGTHVAGLAMGGPDFLQSLPLTLLPPAQSPLLQVTILNIGRGRSDLIHESERQIRDLLAPATPGQAIPQGRIVNMSIAYDGDEASGVLSGIFSEHPDTLFVVAAGNASDNSLNDVNYNPEYPGALGGAPNVISVAAHDSQNPGRLAWFSNFGDGAVGIAAPGCGIQSWVDGTHRVVASGTSQATPLVTFAASLLVTLDSTLKPAQIRNRLFASGDLLGGGEERRNLISQSKLDIPRSLLLFDDVLVKKVPVEGQPGTTRPELWIGQVKDIWFVRCQKIALKYANSINLARFWAFKRQGGDTDLVWGERARGEQRHCPADETAPAPNNPIPFVTFARAAILRDGKIQPEPAAPEQIPLPSIDYLLLRGPYRDHG